MFNGLPEPYASGVGVGKWDRFITYGHKIHDGIPYDFTPENFCQIVDNFSRVFSMRRLGMDNGHKAVHPETPHIEKNLAHYSGLAVIRNGEVIKMWDHDPNRVPPDANRLLAELSRRFPRRTSLDDVGGLWGCKCEVTPFG